MRLSHALIFSGALFAATPALAQDNTAAVDNMVAANATDANAAAPAAAPAAANSALAPTETTTDTNSVTTSKPAQRSFPWGVVGLLGLVGLLGVRKVKG